MLYVSTRNRTDSFTAYRALHEDRAPDGGMYVPFILPHFEKKEIASLRTLSFGESVAQILNRFFSAGLTGWDVDFCIGRRPVKMVRMNHRLVIAEVWHNTDSDYAYLEKSLFDKLCASNKESKITEWARIAIYIAVLFGLYGELSNDGIEELDIAVPAGDFTVLMAAWYARQMGLRIGTIICGCDENGAVWDLLQRGEMSTAAAAASAAFPERDAGEPAELERLIYHTLGRDETLRYLEVSRQGGMYRLVEPMLQELNRGLSAAVIGSTRIKPVINSVYRAADYIVDPSTAVAYGGLQDHRARSGESKLTLILAMRSPIFAAEAIMDATGISAEELTNRINTPKE